jgi:hypothetical protein
MSQRPEGLVTQWRGIDPTWGECGGLSYTNFLVHGSCEAVVQALRNDREMPKQVGDLLANDEGLVGLIREEPVYVYQLRGHDWTQVETWGVVLSGELARDLSRQLNTLAFIYHWEDIASALNYQLFENGDLVEEYSMLYDNPVYQGTQGESDLRQRLAEGWQISSDHTFEFFSRRGTKLDVESSQECHALLGRVVEGLGMFIACLPFWFNPKLRQVAREPGWGRELFAAGKVLYCAEGDRPRQGVWDDAKLILEPPNPPGGSST